MPPPPFSGLPHGLPVTLSSPMVAQPPASSRPGGHAGDSPALPPHGPVPASSPVEGLRLPRSSSGSVPWGRKDRRNGSVTRM